MIIGGSLSSHDLAGDRQRVKDGGGLRKARCGMTNDNRFKADEIILGLVSPPFLVLLLNLFRPFLGYSLIFFNETF